MKEVTTKELSELLGIKSIRQLSETQLKEKLRKLCYKLVKKEKRGRNVMYTLKYEEQDFDINEYVEDEYKVKEGRKFVKHTKIRVDGIEKDTPKTRKEISEEVGVTEMTINNYDKKLEEKEVIKKDGYYYICKIKKTGTQYLVDKEEYNHFWWVNRLIDKEIQSVYNQYRKKEISRKDCEFLVGQLQEQTLGDKYYYKVSKYLLNKDCHLLRLIKCN